MDSIQLNYYSARILKEALVELGYPEVSKIKSKKLLIDFITNLIQSKDDSDSDSDSDSIIEIDMSDVYAKIRNI